MRYAVLLPDWLVGNERAREIAAASAVGIAAAGHEWIGTGLPDVAVAEAERIVVWGLGHPKGQQLLRDAAAAGVAVIGFDLGYWKRSGPHARYRVSVDGAHPGSRVMARARPLDRFLEDGIVLRDDFWNPDGPVVLVGIGFKSADTYGERPGEWEDRALAKIRKAWPGRRVVFRPKAGGGDHKPDGVAVVAGGGIEAVLRGAAAVYCRHSNVAVDAIIAGVPAIAEEGAAAAVCERAPGLNRLPPKLPREVRTAFLGNLAWFQWSAHELRRAETWGVIDDIVRSVP